MKRLGRQKAGRLALATFPVLGFLVLRYVYLSRPQVACAAFLTALKTKDVAAVRQISTPVGFVRMSDLREDRIDEDWKARPTNWPLWKRWAERASRDPTAHGYYEHTDAGEYWIWQATTDDYMGSKVRTRLWFASTAQGWKYCHVDREMIWYNGDTG